MSHPHHAVQPKSPPLVAPSRQLISHSADDEDVTVRPHRSGLLRVLVALAATFVISTTLAAPANAQKDEASDDEPAVCDDSEAGDEEGDQAKANNNTKNDTDDGENAKRGNRRNRDESTETEAETDECDPGPQQVSLADLRSPAPAAVDLELQAALNTVGFLETWHSVTSTHPRLSLLTVSSIEADTSRAALLDLIDELVQTRETTTRLLHASQDAVVRKRTLERTITAIDEVIVQLQADRVVVETNLAGLETDLAVVISAIRGAVVGVYVSDTQEPVPGLDNVEGYNDLQEMQVTVGATIDELLLQRDDLETAIQRAHDNIDQINTTIEDHRTEQADLGDQIGVVEGTLQRLTDEITRLTGRRIEIESGFPQTIGEAQRSRLLATAPFINVSLVTLDAYVQAADDVADRHPSCSVRWEILAAIAKVESAHARHGGASVAPNGDVSDTILGPLLDGTLEGTAVIEDTDNGVLDGDDEYDAAVGPFQFIPGTWRAYGIDSTGDGFADPHNLYDAALSAAGYLCASSDLADDPGIARSVLSYNQSQKYLADVTGFARSYIETLALPSAAYDPETIDPSDGWGVHFEEVDRYAQMGLIGPAATSEPSPDSVTNTGD